MYTKLFKKRVENINQMILEMASGNFSYKVERSDFNDELEKTPVLLNMMAEEIREIFAHYAYVNPHQSYRHLVQMCFLLNDKNQIEGTNPSVNKILGFKSEDLLGMPFVDILSKDAAEEWTGFLQKEKKKTKMILKLSFKTNISLFAPAVCSVSQISTVDHQKKTILFSLHTVVAFQEKKGELQAALQNWDSRKKAKKKKAFTELRRDSDLKKIRALYDHIMLNVDKPLDSLKDLAHKFGTNEFKLKVGFKQLYNNSIFRFQTDERLKRAHYLVKNTELPIKVISEQVGFKSNSHFTRAFQKKYRYSPSTLRKENLRFKKN